jgi:hypothetical protein
MGARPIQNAPTVDGWGVQLSLRNDNFVSAYKVGYISMLVGGIGQIKQRRGVEPNL